MPANIFVLAGLGYGDEGKGSMTDYFVRKHDIRMVVRYNGGSQAAHHVVTPEGVLHCFSQFGSGTFVPGVKTYLSRYMAINPFGIMDEYDALKKIGVNDALKRLRIDEMCPIITPANVLFNQMLEVSRGSVRHGSCGKGVGITFADRDALADGSLLVAKDLFSQTACRDKINFNRRLRLDQAEMLCEEHPGNQELARLLGLLRGIDEKNYVRHYFDFSKHVRVRKESSLLDALSSNGAVFEGAQGVLLDAQAGFFPNVTRSLTTFANADELLSKAKCMNRVMRVGILRAYATRHGAGPFVTEDQELSRTIEPCHNGTNQWQGQFRTGWFDSIAAQYAVEVVGGIDCLALTNLDRLEQLGSVKVCTAYVHDLPVAKGVVDTHFYTRNDGAITAIKVDGADWERSAQRTELLSAMIPKYEAIPLFKSRNSLESYADFIVDQLRAPSLICSYGPAACHKVER